MIQELTSLTDPQRNQVLAIAARARAADHVSPLNDAARLALADEGSSQAIHWLDVIDDDVVGYAQLDQRDGSVQLLIDPAHRRQGRGTALADTVLASEHAVHTWWSFGDLPGAQALARRLGLGVVRALLIMTLDLARISLDDAAPPPAGITIDRYRPADLSRLVQVNAAAFADHPEQGSLTAEDFTARMQQPWHRDTDLLIARDASGELVGYHWTKLDQAADALHGEVYVIGVDPDQAGRGVGRALLEAGIIHMRSRGAAVIELYVEASNQRVVTMYRTAGFEVTHTDVAHGSAEED